MTAFEIYDKAVNSWRYNRGVGTALVSAPLDDKPLVLLLLTNMYANPRNKNQRIVILTETFQERMRLIEYITHQEDEENNKEFKQLLESKVLLILTNKILDKNTLAWKDILTIVYRPESITEQISNVIKISKFKLIVLNKLLDAINMKKIYSLCPLLSEFKQNEIDELRTSTPIEEMLIHISFEEDSKNQKLLNYYNDYISTSISIFGSFDIIQQCRLGNKSLNISATDMCYNIACDNGWNEHLDMSVELNQQIDTLYNPRNIRERASETFNIIRNRCNLLASCEEKLEKIFEIVDSHKDTKILIINKQGEFANKVTDYINNHSETIICGNYHDYVEPIDAIDVYDNPLYVKSGPNKGERKVLMAKAQKSLNNSKYNMGRLNILSTTNAPDKDLLGEVDVVIITSPLCDTIESYLYRLSNVRFKNPIELFTIYVNNSLESTKIENREIGKYHNVLNNEEINILSENNSDFIIVD